MKEKPLGYMVSVDIPDGKVEEISYSEKDIRNHENRKVRATIMVWGGSGIVFCNTALAPSLLHSIRQGANHRPSAYRRIKTCGVQSGMTIDYLVRV